MNPNQMLQKIVRWDWFALIIPLIGLSPLLYLQSWFLWEKEHLQFFPLAFAAIIYFFLNEGKSDQPVSPNTMRATLAVIGICLGCFFGIVALIRVSPWLAHFTIIWNIFFWALGRFASMSTLRIVGICGLGAVTIPPPFGLDHKLVQTLQSFSSTICSNLMDCTEILYVKRGNIIEIVSKPLFIEEACSGVDSQYALMAVAGVLLLIGNTGFIASLITIVTVPIWAILGNLLRIYSIVIGLEFFNIDLSSGFVHTLLGLLVFSVAAWAHWSSVQLLVFLQKRFFANCTGLRLGWLRNPGTFNPAFLRVKLPSSLPLFALPVLILILFPAGCFAVLNHLRMRMPTISQEVADRMPKADAIPRILSGQRQVRYSQESRTERNQFGQHSHVWAYSGEIGSQTLSFDFVFRDWHPLWVCYQSAGWKTTKIQRVEATGQRDSAVWPLYEVVMENQQGEYAHLLFTFFNENGRMYNYEGALDRDIGARVPVTFLDIVEPPEDFENPLLFQIQQLLVSNNPITPEQMTRQHEMFLNVREILRDASIPVLEAVKASANR